MKRLLALVLLTAALLTGCASEFPSPDAAAQMSTSDADALLLGVHADALNREWGAPDRFLPDRFGDCWALEDGRELHVYYDDNACVEGYAAVEEAPGENQ